MSRYDRNSGRTTKLLKATPDGGIFVVHSSKMINFIEHWLREHGRKRNSVRIISADCCFKQLRGMCAPITVDHTVEECDFIPTADLDAIEHYKNYYAPVVISLDQDGDVAVRYNQL